MLSLRLSKLFRTLVAHGKGKAARAAVANSIGLALRASLTAAACTEALDLQESIVARKDILQVSLEGALTEIDIPMSFLTQTIQLTTRDVGVMLAGVSSLVENEQGFESQSFHSSFLLLSALLKHYPQALYSCSAVLVGVYRSLFSRCLVEGGRGMCLRMSKLFELLKPHSSVFKKG